MPTITLIGYRGTGKSTVARELGLRLGCPWWDADVELERVLGTSIGELLRDRGEPAFRDEEAKILDRLLDEADGVLATGGGVVLRSDNRGQLQSRGGYVVWLTAPADSIRRRLAADPTTASRRPGLTGSDPLAEVDAALVGRAPLYRACARLEVDSSSASPAEIADLILRSLKSRDAHPPVAPGQGTSS